MQWATPPGRGQPNSHGGMGPVHVFALYPAPGKLTGGADTGAGGMALLAPWEVHWEPIVGNHKTGPGSMSEPGH